MSWDKVNKDIESGPFGLVKWIVLGVLFVVLVGAAISWVMRPADMAINRIVTKQSFQYKEGMAQRGAILEANIAEIDALLLQAPENRDQLLAQKRILQAQLRAITINQ